MITVRSGGSTARAGAQVFALTLCNAHAEDNLFHSGQAPGENVVGAGVACDGNNTYFVAQYR